MTIDEIAMKVAREVPAYPYDEPYAFHKRFAHALLAELAKQAHACEVIGREGSTIPSMLISESFCPGTKLYAAPTPKEES